MQELHVVGNLSNNSKTEKEGHAGDLMLTWCLRSGCLASIGKQGHLCHCCLPVQLLGTLKRVADFEMTRRESLKTCGFMGHVVNILFHHMTAPVKQSFMWFHQAILLDLCLAHLIPVTFGQAFPGRLQGVQDHQQVEATHQRAAQHCT